MERGERRMYTEPGGGRREKQQRISAKNRPPAYAVI
jgi:hypothetical protein